MAYRWGAEDRELAPGPGWPQTLRTDRGGQRAGAWLVADAEDGSALNLPNPPHPFTSTPPVRALKILVNQPCYS